MKTGFCAALLFALILAVAASPSLADDVGKLCARKSPGDYVTQLSCRDAANIAMREFREVLLPAARSPADKLVVASCGEEYKSPDGIYDWYMVVVCIKQGGLTPLL